MLQNLNPEILHVGIVDAPQRITEKQSHCCYSEIKSSLHKGRKESSLSFGLRGPKITEGASPRATLVVQHLWVSELSFLEAVLASTVYKES